MSDLDRLAEMVKTIDPKRIHVATRGVFELIELAPTLIAVAKAVRPVRRGDGRLACTMCKSAWLMPSLEVHTPECPLFALDAKFAEMKKTS